MDKYLKTEQLEIQHLPQSMSLKQDQGSLLEAFLMILTRCKKFKDLVDNTDFYDFLKANYKGQKSLDPILALYNLVYSVYTTVEPKYGNEDFCKIVEDIRKNLKREEWIQKLSDIELAVYAMTSSFRILASMMREARQPSRDLPVIFEELFSAPVEKVSQFPILVHTVSLLYKDYKASNSGMDVEGFDAQFEVLKNNFSKLSKLLKDLTKVPIFSKEMLIFSSLYNFDDEESPLFNELVCSFTKAISEMHGNKHINPDIIRPITFTFLGNSFKMARYDMQNQVNFGLVNIDFDYMKLTRTIGITLMGNKQKNSVKEDNNKVGCFNGQIVYINKFDFQGIPNLEQDHTEFKVARIRNYLMKIMEFDPDTDLLNDYDCIAYYQSYHETQKANFYRFLNIEDRLTEITVGNKQNTKISLYFSQERRLSEPRGLKIFYSLKMAPGSILQDSDNLLYVSQDNEEHLQYFIEYIYSNHILEEVNHNAKSGGKNEITDIAKKLTFYLPSTLENKKDIDNWKKISAKKTLSLQTPLSDIYSELVKHSQMDLYDPEDPHSHMYMNCFLDISSILDCSKLATEEFDKYKKASSAQLNSNLTDIFEYGLSTFKRSLQSEAFTKPREESTELSQAVWSHLNNYPPRMFLPSFLVVNLYKIRTILELKEHLTFEYLEEKILEQDSGLSPAYSLVGLIAQFKKPSPTGPVYYPIVKETEALCCSKYRGFLVEKTKPNKPVKEVVCDIAKIDKELMHWAVLERREVQF